MTAKISTSVIGLLLIAYVLFLIVARAPAIWGAWAIHNAMPNVWLTGIAGTLWQGSAQAAQLDIGPASGADAIPLGTVTWSLKPLSLLLLTPCVDITTEMPGQASEGRFCISLSGAVHIKTFVFESSASIINRLLPLDINGQVSVNVVEGRFSQDQVETLDARMSWADARVHTGEKWLSLGAYAAVFTAPVTSKKGANNSAKKGSDKSDGNVPLESGRVDDVAASLFDIDGPLKVNIKGQWSFAEEWKMSGTFHTQAGTPTEVIQALQLFGEEQSSNTYFVRWPQ